MSYDIITALASITKDIILHKKQHRGCLAVLQLEPRVDLGGSRGFCPAKPLTRDCIQSLSRSHPVTLAKELNKMKICIDTWPSFTSKLSGPAS